MKNSTVEHHTNSITITYQYYTILTCVSSQTNFGLLPMQCVTQITSSYLYELPSFITL